MSDKPQLADDANLDTLPYKEGVLGLPKIDGVRAMNLQGTLTGRSLDPFEGFGITDYFSKPQYVHLDGEMTLGSDPCGDGLCRLTTGAMGRIYEKENKKKLITQMDDYYWWLFDYLVDPSLSYEWRYDNLRNYVARELADDPRIHVVPAVRVHDKDHAIELLGGWLDANYEGAIWRAANEPAKPGRPGKKQQQYMRSKPWMTSELLCTGVTEGSKNNNEAKTNTLGRTERSSAKDGLVANGEIGSIQGILLADIFHPHIAGKLLLPKGLPVTISSGEMSVKEAKHYFVHQEEIVNHIVTFNHLAHGVKDTVRMGQYKSHRLPQDMS